MVNTSKNVLLALTNSEVSESRLSFTLPDAVSGKFVQKYFQYLNLSK
jgi:hypothetical protein